GFSTRRNHIKNLIRKAIWVNKLEYFSVLVSSPMYKNAVKCVVLFWGKVLERFWRKEKIE
ncbi:TPA: hypothetical protein ACG32O_001669, partial [Escherichia coli]